MPSGRPKPSKDKKKKGMTYKPVWNPATVLNPNAGREKTKTKNKGSKKK